MQQYLFLHLSLLFSLVLPTNMTVVIFANLYLPFELQGVQFHPESIITSEGKTLVVNFIKLIDKLDSDPLGTENLSLNASR